MLRNGRSRLALVGAVALAVGIGGQGRAAQREQVIQTGEVLALRMNAGLSSKTSKAGDRFTATVFQPLLVDGDTVVPEGATVEGHVTSVEPAKRLSRSGTISVDFDRLVWKDGRSVPIVGQLTSLDPEERRKIDEEGQVEGSSTTKRNIIFIGGGAGAGAIIGAVAGNTGAGAGVGAGLGTAAVLLSKGNEATIPVGFEFGLEVLKTVRVPTSRGGVFDSRDDLLYAQNYLRDMGYFAGTVDGRMTPSTKAALVRFQRSAGFRETGALDFDAARSMLLVDDNGVRTQPVKVTGVESRIGEDGAVDVQVTATLNSGGWNVYESHFVNRDTLHVYVRGVPPTGPATQAITRQDVRLTLAPNEARGVTQYVVHAQGEDTRGEIGVSSSAVDVRALNARVNAMLTDYERALGIRTLRSGAVVLGGRNYTDGEMELYFAVNQLSSSLRLYSAVSPSLRDDAKLKGALQLIVRAARQVDRAIGRAATSRTTGAERDWSALRPEFADLAQSIGASLDREDR